MFKKLIEFFNQPILPEERLAKPNDVHFYSSDNWGTICAVDHRISTIYIHKDQWAPGIWAGTEGATILINNHKYIILAVDLEHRSLKLNDTSRICAEYPIKGIYA